MKDEHDSCCCNHAHASSNVSQSLEETFFTSKRSIHAAVLHNDLPHVSALLSRSPSRVNELDSAGYTPFLYAKSVDMIDLLTNLRADIHAMTPSGRRTLLHRVVLWQTKDCIEAVLKAGISDTKDADGKYAADLAHDLGALEIEKVIREYTKRKELKADDALSLSQRGLALAEPCCRASYLSE